MPDTHLPSKNELEEVVQLIASKVIDYFNQLDQLPVMRSDVKEALATFDVPLPENGEGTQAALMKLLSDGMAASVASSGPRFFHFVVGGVTPAAFGSEWLQVALDQIAYAHITSPLAVKLERLSLDWLKEIFEIPPDWGGVMTTGATMGMYVGLIAARDWYGEQLGVNTFNEGIYKLGKIPVFASGIIHASGIKVLAMLGIGSDSIQTIKEDETGTFDPEELENKLKALNGKPSIIVGVAGEPNAGLFDPIPEIAKLARKYNAWLHVDGAFGLFAQLVPDRKHLLKNLSMARSVSVDGHKWLNVPYDCGMAFVENPKYMRQSFKYSADYLPESTDEEFVFGVYGPESSRRGRSLAVWATLFAYGKNGLAKMINKNISQAQFLTKLIKESENFELLHENVINVVCFRYNPGDRSEEELDQINQSLGRAIIDDGRVFLGTTKFKGKVAMRPAFANWRTEISDVQFAMDVIGELARKINAK